MKKPIILSKNDLKVLIELAEFKEFLDKQKEKSKKKKTKNGYKQFESTEFEI